MASRAVFITSLLSLLAFGCSGSSPVTPDSGTPDSGTPDSGTPDAALADSGLPDAALADSGMDSGTMDAGPPLGALGDTCTVDGDCASNICYPTAIGADLCSACLTNADCAVGTCTYGLGDAYALCVGSAALGDPCTVGTDCASGFCNGSMVCSECLTDADCRGDGTCADVGDGYETCSGGLGSTCNVANAGADCNSGYCYDGIGPLDLCSDCAADGDCDVTQACTFSADLLYYTCTGTLALGATCSVDGDCESAHCVSTVCAECVTSADCTVGGTCSDLGNGYLECSGGLGDPCATGTDCTSGLCYTSGGMNPVAACSLCVNNGDCPGSICFYNPLSGYANCL